MTGGTTLVYSPGYQLPLWLGDGQLRLWRFLDRELGTRNYASTTVRAIARHLGVNPGSVARDLDALSRLGYATHLAEWGRAGVRLWRVVARGGRRGLDARRRWRAMRRMGVPAPGQLTIYAAGVAGLPTPSATVGGGVPPRPPTGTPTPPAIVDRLHATDAAGGSSSGERSPDDAPFGIVRCDCGRLRLTRTGAPVEPCPHVRAGAPAARPAPPNDDPPEVVDPTPATAVACLDYSGHRFDHRYIGERWVCAACVGDDDRAALAADSDTPERPA